MIITRRSHVGGDKDPTAVFTFCEHFRVIKLLIKHSIGHKKENVNQEQLRYRK